MGDNILDSPKLLEVYRAIPKIELNPHQRGELEQMSASMKEMSKNSLGKMRQIDFEMQASGVDAVLSGIDESGGVPETSEGKKMLMDKMIISIGGWPDRPGVKGMTINDWRAEYHRYLGINEAVTKLGWTEEDTGRSEDEVFSFCGGATQRVMTYFPQNK